MSGVAIEIMECGLDAAIANAARLDGIDRLEMMEVIGRLVQGQTRQRIAVDKTAPDGTPWVPNSTGSSTLYAAGHLHDSIDYRAGFDQVEIGSPLIYAAIHHFGGVIEPKKAKRLVFTIGNRKVFAKKVTIPARPYIGLSTDNIEEIEAVVSDFIAEVLQ